MQTRSVEPTHRRAARLRASDIEELYRIDEGLTAPGAGVVVVVVDDLLTSGAHFRAAQRVLSRRFTDIDVVGLFLARRVMETAAESGPGVTVMSPAEGAEGERREGGGVLGPKVASEVSGAERGSRPRRGESGRVQGVEGGDAPVKTVAIINYKGASARRR